VHGRRTPFLERPLLPGQGRDPFSGPRAAYTLCIRHMRSPRVTSLPSPAREPARSPESDRRVPGDLVVAYLTAG
jgi:hypothetical protein